MTDYLKTYDERVGADSILMEITIKEYLKFVVSIINKNEYQRRKVNKPTVYTLLKEDLKKKCTFPPITLAINITPQNIDSYEKISNIIEDNIEKIIILDGLQRTFTMLEIEKEFSKETDDPVEKAKNIAELESFYSHKIRLELFIGIDKLGILYRMLTLNTGQTPMSLRHQIEIIYLDYINQSFDGIELLREIDDSSVSSINQYKFSDIIEGFQSYLEMDPLPLDRYDLLDIIKGLETLREENQKKDLFREFLSSYHKFVLKIYDLADGWSYNTESSDIPNSAISLGKSIEKIFKKPQVISGFAAGIGKLIMEFKKIGSFSDLEEIIDSISFTEKDKALNNLIDRVDEISKRAKKIGNAQRLYFTYFFRELFNKNSDSYLIIDKAVENSYEKYKVETF